MPDGGEREDPRASADRRLSCHRNVADEFATLAELDLGADHAERTDFRARADFRAVFDNGGLVNEGFHQSITSMALTSASQTSTPSTLASPLYHHMLRRLFSFFM